MRERADGKRNAAERRLDAAHVGPAAAVSDARAAVLDAAAFKAEALRLGAAEVGLASATDLTGEWPYLQAYLSAGAQGDMTYLTREPEKRCRPEAVLPGVCTVAVCAFSYFPRPDLYAYHPRIARFAQGEDYHRVIRHFLKSLTAYVTQRHPGARCRGVVDTAPILEKAWAVRAGVGRIGRNNLLQHPRLGSYLFLGLLLTDLPADGYDMEIGGAGAPAEAGVSPAAAGADTPLSGRLPDRCLRCRACVDACPTGALSIERAPRLRADLCLSYVTIEKRPDGQGRKTFPPLRPQAGAAPLAIFGCDICQSVCPANRPGAAEATAPATDLAADHAGYDRPEPHPAFIPAPGLATLSQTDFARLDATAFQQLFARSAIRRAGPDGLQANLNLWK